MSNNLTSSYTLNLLIKDDKSRDAVRELEKELRNLGQTVDEAAIDNDLTRSLEETQKAAQLMIDKFHEMARNQELDFATVSKAYSRNAGKAIAELERQYATIKDQLDAVQKKYYENAANLKAYNEGLEKQNISEENRANLISKIKDLEKEQRKLDLERLKAQVEQNRQIRFNLKAAEQTARDAHANVKYEKLREQQEKLKVLQIKRKMSRDKAEKKELDEKIKRQKAYVSAIELGIKAQQSSLKQQNAITAAIQNSEKAQSHFANAREKARVALQTTYNAAGLIGGAGRMLSGGIHAASSGMAMISDASNRALERERAAGRVKGVDADTASKLIGDVYIKTGADTQAIVDAINRVRSLLGNLSNDEIAQAASLEIRYPGMSMSLASVTDPVKKDDMLVYANKMKAIQAATGASEEQLATSTQAFANRKDIVKAGGSVSDYQAVYLAMQNSGAFDTDEELEYVFKQFVRKQRASKKSVFEFAKDFKMEKYARGERNKLQAKNADEHMKWDDLATAASTNSTDTPAQTTAEKNAERIRNLEERKNQMMIKLIDIIEPIVNELSRVLDNDKIKRLVDGLIKFITDVMPILADVILKIAEKLGDIIDLGGETLEKAAFYNELASERSPGVRYPKYANGGIVWGTSIVGERGPEAIIPLDYSRAQRAENIAYSIQNNFSMSGNETTALSLAQAVSSRDFSRAMGKAAFKAGRLGAF